MATRALIGYLDDNRVLTSTYNHYDGYPDHLGKILDTYYSRNKRARDVANKGYISYFEDDGDIVSKNPEKKPYKLNLNGEWEDALYSISQEIDSFGADFAYIWYKEDGDWVEIKNTGTQSMIDQLANQLASAATMFGPVDENDITVGDESIPIDEAEYGKYFGGRTKLSKPEMIPTTPGKIELGDDGEPHVTVMSNAKRKEAMRSVLDILKKELDVETDDAFTFIKTHRDELFDGTVNPFDKDEVVDEYNEFLSVNTEYVKEEDNVEVDYSDSSKGDDAIERESASGAFEEAINWRGETLKEQFKRLIN